MAIKPHPRIYQWMQEIMPAFVAAIDNVGRLIGQAGPLDEKSIQLIQLAAVAAIRSQDSVHSHTRRALEAGASLQRAS